MAAQHFAHEVDALLDHVPHASFKEEYLIALLLLALVKIFRRY